MAHGRCSETRRRSIILPALALLASVAAASPAAAQFSVNGQKVAPVESNFAGVRQVTPRHGLVVQINHDVQLPMDLDLDLVDGTFTKLLVDHRRDPLVPATRLVVVVTTEAKITKFGQGGRRRMFRWLEPELRQRRDFHVSPVAIFISDRVAADRMKLETTLRRALGFYFDPRLKEALDAVDVAPPDGGGTRHRH